MLGVWQLAANLAQVEYDAPPKLLVICEDLGSDSVMESAC